MKLQKKKEETNAKQVRSTVFIKKKEKREEKKNHTAAAVAHTFCMLFIRERTTNNIFICLRLNVEIWQIFYVSFLFRDSGQTKHTSYDLI